MKKIQKTHVIHNNQTYHGHIFYPEENTTQYWKDIYFRDCSFRGDITIGSMENCHFENCSFSGTVGVRLQFIASKKIPDWCLFLPRIDRLKIYDPHMTSLPENMDKLESLVELDVSGCGTLRMLNGVETLSNLRSLNLQECFNLEIGSGEQFSQITELKLLGIGLQHGDLNNIKRLEKLCVYEFIWSSLEILSGLKNLHHLQVCKGMLRNIDDLQYLENLKFLDLHEANGFDNTDVLFFLSQLEYLDLSQTKIAEVNFHLPHLKTLKLEQCQDLRKIDITCEELRHLTIKGSHNLNDLDFLNKLHNLRHFNAQYSKSQKNYTLSLPSTIENCNILDCTSITQVKNTNKLPNLKELHIGCNILDNFDFCQLPQLHSLRLSKVYLEKEENISTALQNVNLEYLDVDGKISGLDHLTNLREIRLRYCTLDEFSFLPTSVQSVYLYHCHFINPNILKAWCGIHTLHVESGSTEAYFGVLSEFNKLTTLSIHGGTLVDLHGLRGQTSITTLKLNSCHNLSNIEILATLENLHSLSIKFCSLVNFTCISKLQNLKKLTLHNNHTPISGLENLRCTDICVAMD